MRNLVAFVVLGMAALASQAQITAVAPASKPADRVIGEVTSLNLASGTMTVKEDKTNTAYAVQLGTAQAILQVPPGEKDLKKAVRVRRDQLAVGDRVVIRGKKSEGTTGSIDAASILVMTASDLQQKRAAEASDWQQRGVAGTVQSVDAAAQRLVLTERTAEGPKQITVTVGDKAEVTRFVADKPKTPAPSKLSEIAVGDQARVLGNRSADGSEVTAERIYSGSFKTIPGTIVSISADKSEVTVTDFRSKQPVKVSLTPESVVRRLPPSMAAALANRSSATGGQPNSGPAPTAEPSSQSGPAKPHGGDISQMLERVPPIAVTELTPGDAVIVFGGTSSNGSSLAATNIIAGVGPLLQATPSASGRRQGGSAADNWNLDFGLPAQ